MDREHVDPEPQDSPPRHLIGVGLGRAELDLVAEACAEHSVTLHAADDVRELLPMVINVGCGGIVMGDRTSAGGAKAFDINLATLKRLRSHRRGGETPILYLAHWPVREHVLKLAQLGIRDLVGQPACQEYIEQRIEEFVALVKQRPPQWQTS